VSSHQPAPDQDLTDRVRIKDRIEYVVFLCFYRALHALPRSVASRVGALLGSALSFVLRQQRRVALANLRIAFPEKSERERRAILRRSCRNLGRVGAEFCHLESLTGETVRDYIALQDTELWQKAVVDRHGGAVVLTAHLGNWELLAYAHGLLGHPVTIVHRPLRNPLIDRFINGVRARAGTRHINKKAAAREALRSLRNGDLVVIPSDQNQTRRFGVFVNLFGLPASTTPGAPRLAMHAGVPVIPAFLVREGESDRFRLVILPPVELAQSGDRAADIVTSTQRCSDAIECMLRQHPDQWIWFHKRWRTRPEGTARIY